MANTESTFADRRGRGQELLEGISDFTPVFAPADDALLPANYATFLGTLDTANGLVDSLSLQYTTSVTNRQEMVKQIKRLAMQSFSYVRSSSDYRAYIPTLDKPYKKLRGYRAKRQGAPPQTPPPQTRNTGEQSFADILKLFYTFITALSQLPDYAPGNTEITVAALGVLGGQLRDLNKDMIDLDLALITAVINRHRLYYNEDGLRGKIKTIKLATVAQYGRDSVQYQSIRHIRF